MDKFRMSLKSEKMAKEKGEKANEDIISELNKKLEKYSIKIIRMYNERIDRPIISYDKNNNLKRATIMPRRFEFEKNNIRYDVAFQKDEYYDDECEDSSSLTANLISIIGRDGTAKKYYDDTKEFKFWKNVAQEAKKMFIKYYTNEIQQTRANNYERTHRIDRANALSRPDPLAESYFNY